MTTLLLVEPRSVGWGGVDWVRARAGASGGEALVLGPGGAAWARAAGLARWRAAGAPLGRPELAGAAVRSAEGVRRIEAWSTAALRLAALAAPGAERTVCLLDPPTARDAAPGLLRLAPRRIRRPDAHAVFASEHVARAWRSSGLFEVQSETIEPPPLDGGRLGGVDRAAVRAGWGLENEFAVALFAEPEPDGAARRLAFILGLLGVAGRRVAAVCHPEHGGLERLKRFFERLVSPPRLVIDAAPSWEIARGIDAAVWLAMRHSRVGDEPSAGPWAARWALAAGTPVVAERCERTEGPLEGAEIVPRGDLHVARALLRIADAG